ncbi:MAG: hypothetical protein HeimC3_16740 [Candidatus Heimdallarchaeota archaeon LC_3]|nr:MAG: hypothetical protein HeimC3_16740 [Candidatus Heimdallarchaeota archaeon LC_3]
MKNLDAINDVFVISISGIPYYYGCFGGKKCAKEQNHLLFGGFFAAILQFSLNLENKTIREIILYDTQISIEFREIGNEKILIIFFATKKINSGHLRQIVQRTADAFTSNYSKKLLLKNKLINRSHFESFTDILYNAGIVKRPKSTRAQTFDCEWIRPSKPGLIYCLKQKKAITIEEEIKYASRIQCPFN